DSGRQRGLSPVGNSFNLTRAGIYFCPRTGLAERLVQVGAQVLHVLEPQGESEEVLAYAQLLPDRRGDGLGGAGHGVVEQGLRAPKARRGLDQPYLLEDVDGLLLPALDL